MHQVDILDQSYCLLVRSDIISSLLFFRVGRVDASSRQDIVLSGHFIKDEHCTFTSSNGPVGESGWSLSFPTGLLLYLWQFDVDRQKIKPHVVFFVPKQQLSWSPVKELRLMSTARE